MTLLNIRPDETPFRTYGRGVFGAMMLTMVASWNLWLGAVVLVAILGFLAFLARRPETHWYARQALKSFAITLCALGAIVAVRALLGW